MMGRMPSIAAPMAEPTMASSLIGASSTRPGNSFGQIFRGLERAAERAHVLPVNKNARIIRQRLGLRLANGFQIGDAHDFWFVAFDQDAREASARQFSLYGSGAGFALDLATASSICWTISLRQMSRACRIGPLVLQQMFLGDFEAIAAKRRGL